MVMSVMIAVRLYFLFTSLSQYTTTLNKLHSFSVFDGSLWSTPQWRILYFIWPIIHSGDDNIFRSTALLSSRSMPV